MTENFSTRSARGRLRRQALAAMLLCQMLLLVFAAAAAALDSVDTERGQLIVSLTEQIAAAADAEEKGRLFLHRARQHARQGASNEALLDYRQALVNYPAGWILNEYGHYLYHCGEFEQAYQTAKKVLAEFPYLEGEAAALKAKAKQSYQEQYEKEHPPTIIMDNRADPRRVTRHDLIRRLKVEPSSTQYPPISTPSVQRKAAAAPKSTTRKT